MKHKSIFSSLALATLGLAVLLCLSACREEPPAARKAASSAGSDTAASDTAGNESAVEIAPDSAPQPDSGFAAYEEQLSALRERHGMTEDDSEWMQPPRSEAEIREEQAQLSAWRNANLRFVESLRDSLAQAGSVVLVEHSDRLDRRRESDTYREKIYRRAVLTESQVQSLRRMLSKVELDSHEWGTACVASPHHRLEIDRSGKRQTLEVCFECAQASWSGAEGAEVPEDFFRVFGQFVESVGMETTRDWFRLAKDEATPSG